MSITKPSNAVMAWPAQTQDTIIAADTIIIGTSNNLGSVDFPIDMVSGIGLGVTGPGLPLGIYSLDNAPTTWYECNGLDGPIRANIKIADSGTTAHFIWAINPLVPGYGAGASIQITFKWSLFALPTTSKITAPVGGAFVAYKSKDTYNKLFASGEVAKVASNTVTVAHNLGYVSSVRIWDHSGGLYFPATQAGFLGGGLMWDANNLYLSALSVDTGNWVYRVYYET